MWPVTSHLDQLYWTSPFGRLLGFNISSFVYVYHICIHIYIYIKKWYGIYMYDIYHKYVCDNIYDIKYHMWYIYIYIYHIYIIYISYIYIYISYIYGILYDVWCKYTHIFIYTPYNIFTNALIDYLAMGNGPFIIVWLKQVNLITGGYIRAYSDHIQYLGIPLCIHPIISLLNHHIPLYSGFLIGIWPPAPQL